ncbi:Crp/Fnr family transcriptional regulator [Paenibacillus sp. GCM10023248]|uniref:Crp/Fnr family transcriptional regulator n=1 Tax=Bacillales TaxID=1385 RepID=UPI0023781C08|nr:MULTISPECIES: Crp/Fnr family transcriptional regulator [Bacillales]MDD9271087.1 Crp/Fnr family transcriptional regulator [Paenibacillus sp. MAHUQ-63]MDR6885058.1 CRP/FNR family transcriptional regulator [Bacillus sp. 3255]
MKTIISLLHNVPLFQQLTEEDLQGIAPLFTEKRVKKGSILFLEGDEGGEFFLIKSGVVKIYRLDESKEIILALFRDGDFFGEMSLIGNSQTRSATAETLDPCTLYVLKRSVFSQYLEKSPKLLLKLLETTMDRLRQANEQIYDLTFLGVRSRIIKTIIRLSEQHGIPTQDGLLINVKLTHQQIANMVGTVRESVTKVLQELLDDEYIQIEKKLITLRNIEAIKGEIR